MNGTVPEVRLIKAGPVPYSFVSRLKLGKNGWRGAARGQNEAETAVGLAKNEPREKQEEKRGQIHQGGGGKIRTAEGLMKTAVRAIRVFRLFMVVVDIPFG